MRNVYTVPNETINTGTDFLLSTFFSESNIDVEEAAFHDFYTDQAVDIEVKMNNASTFHAFATGQTGFFRIEMAGVADIKVIATVDSTTLEITGSDYSL